MRATMTNITLNICSLNHSDDLLEYCKLLDHLKNQGWQVVTCDNTEGVITAMFTRDRTEHHEVKK